MRRRLVALLIVATSACASGAGEATTGIEAGRPPEIRPTVGQTTRTEAARRAAIERLLDHAKVETVITARAPDFTRRVAYLGGDLTDAELERLVGAVTEAFAPGRLREDIARVLAREAPDGMVDRVLEWMEGGATAELERTVDAYEPPGTLEDFVAGLEPDELGAPRRVSATVEWTRVQGAGDFYVLLDEALTQGAHETLAVFRTDAPTFEPLTGEALEAQLQASFNASVVSSLYRLETVPQDVLDRATAEYASESGQWFIQAYSLAVAEAMRSAAGRAMAALAAGGR